MSASKDIKVLGLYVYPIKSCGSVEVDQLELCEHGVKWDRVWGLMLVKRKEILTQRAFPIMGRIKPQILEKEGVLRVTVPAPDGVSASEAVTDDVPLTADPTVGETIKDVWLWNSDHMTAIAPSAKLDAAISRLLGDEVRLVRFADEFRAIDTTVPVSPHPGQNPTKHLSAKAKARIEPAPPGKEITKLVYQDWFALHFTSITSLRNIQVALLKSIYPDYKVDPKLEQAAYSEEFPAVAYPANLERIDRKLWTPEYIQNIRVTRFRPNVVFDGPDLKPFEEDKWMQVDIEPVEGSTEGRKKQLIDINFRTGRCPIPTMNQEEAKADNSFLPNRVIQKYRLVDGLQQFAPAFGIYGTPDVPEGKLRVGDTIKVLKTGERFIANKPQPVNPEDTPEAIKTRQAKANIPWTNLLFVLFTVLTGIGMGVWVTLHKDT